MTEHVIYGLHDAEGKVRYVGRTTNLKERFAYWLKRKNWLVGIVVIEAGLLETDAKDREKFWIASYGLEALENKRITGTGGTNDRAYKPLSDEHKEKIRQGNLNRAAISKELGISYFSEEGHLNLRLSKMGNPARKGQPHSEETKARMRAAWAKRKEKFGSNGWKDLTKTENEQ